MLKLNEDLETEDPKYWKTPKSATPEELAYFEYDRADTAKKNAEAAKRSSAAYEQKKKYETNWQKEYGQLNPEQFQQKLQTIQTKKLTIDNLLKKHDELNKELSLASTDLAGLHQTLSEQAAANPELAPQLEKQYRDAYKALELKAGTLGNLETSIIGMMENTEKDEINAARKQRELEAQQGSIPGALWNKAMKGIGGVAAGETDILLTALSYVMPKEFLGPEGTTPEQAAVQAKKDMLPAIREGMNKVFGDGGTTDEYIKNREKNLVARSVLGLTQSVPAMATPLMSGIFLQTYDGMKSQMEGDQWKDVSEAEKMAFAAGIGTVSALLERAGFSNMVKNTPIVRGIMQSAVNKLAPGSTKADIARVLEAETSSAIANFLSRSAGGFAAEAETGGLQGLVEGGAMWAYEGIKSNPELFKGNADSWSEVFSDAAMGALEEGIGGHLMSLPGALASARSAKDVTAKQTVEQYVLMEKLVASPDFATRFADKTAADLKNGKINQSQADIATDALERAKTAVESIPEGMPDDKRQEAFALILEKQLLSKKDKNLVSEKIAAINEKLAALAGVKPKETEKKAEEPAAKKEEAPAKPAVTPVADTPAPTAEWSGSAIVPKKATDPTAPTPTIGRADVATEFDDEPEVGKVMNMRVRFSSGGDIVVGTIGAHPEEKNTIVLFEDNGNMRDIGTMADLAMKPIGDAGIELEDTAGKFSVNADGVISSGGVKYIAPKGVDHIVRNEDGTIFEVTLPRVTKTGKPRKGSKTFRGGEAEQLAYELTLKDYSENADEQYHPELDALIVDAEQGVETGKATQPARPVAGEGATQAAGETRQGNTQAGGVTQTPAQTTTQDGKVDQEGSQEGSREESSPGQEGGQEGSQEEVAPATTPTGEAVTSPSATSAPKTAKEKLEALRRKEGEVSPVERASVDGSSGQRLNPVDFKGVKTTKDLLDVFLRIGSSDALKEIAAIIAASPASGETDVVFIKAGDKGLPKYVIDSFNAGTHALFYHDPEGRAKLYFREDVADFFTEEAVVHEPVHAVTSAAIRRSPALKKKLDVLGLSVANSLYEASKDPEVAKSIGLTTSEAKELHDYWTTYPTENAQEVLAYGLTSPRMREVLSKFAADGRPLSGYRTPGMQDRVRVSEVRPDSREPAAPEQLTLWDKFVDLITSALGMDKARALRFKQATEQYLNDKAAHDKAWKDYNTTKSLRDELLDIMNKAIADSEANGTNSSSGSATPMADKLAGEIVVDGKTRPTTNSEGRPIHPTIEGVRNFWRWFGDSKVVDAEGRPLVVYHGTNADFDSFKQASEGSLGNGIYLSSSASAASVYSEISAEGAKRAKGGNVMPVYVASSNPLVIKDGGAAPAVDALVALGVPAAKAEAIFEKAMDEHGNLRSQISTRLRAAGYDGLVVEHSNGNKEVVVHAATSVKSATGNSGAFDPANRAIDRLGPTSSDIPSKEWNAAIDEAVAMPDDASDIDRAKAAVRSLTKSDWFKSLGPKKKSEAAIEIKDTVAAALGIKRTNLNNKKAQPVKKPPVKVTTKGARASFKLGVALTKKQADERAAEMAADFAEWAAQQKAKTKAEKAALIEKYAERFGQHKAEAKEILDAKKAELKEAKAAMRVAMAAANKAISDGIAAAANALKQGKRAGLNDAKAYQKQAADMVKGYIKQMTLTGKITGKQARTLARYAGNVNFASVKSMEKFMDMADKVMSDVAYANKLSEARKLQKKAKQKAAPAMGPMTRRMTSIRPDNLPTDLLDDYIDALRDMVKDVPSYAQILSLQARVEQAISATVTPFSAVDTAKEADEALKKVFSNPVQTLEDYKDLLREANRFMRRITELLQNGVITEGDFDVLADQVGKSESDLQEKFKSEIESLKTGMYLDIRDSIARFFATPSTRKLETHQQALMDRAKDLSKDELMSLSPMDMLTLSEIVDTATQDKFIDVLMMKGILDRAENTARVKELVEQIKDSKPMKKNMGDLVKEARTKMSSFWEGMMGLGNVQFGAYYRNVIHVIEQASAKRAKFIKDTEAGILDLMGKHKVTEYDLDAAGMIMHYLREYGAGLEPKNASIPDVGKRDRFRIMLEQGERGEAAHNRNKRKRSLLSRPTTQHQRIKEAWEKMPKVNGSVDPEAVYRSFMAGDGRFVPKNVMAFLRDANEWKDTILLPMQQYANNVSGKEFEALPFHIKRILLNRDGNVVSGGSAINVVSANGTTLKFAANVGKKSTEKDVSDAVETDVIKLLMDHAEETSRNYYYTPALQQVNDLLARTRKELPDQKKDMVTAIANMTMASLNNEFKHVPKDFFSRAATAVLRAKSAQVLIAPTRMLVEIASFFASAGLKSGAFKGSYAELFKSRKTGLALMSDADSTLQDRDALNRAYEYVEGEVRQKGKLERLAHYTASAPEMIGLVPVWAAVFKKNFEDIAGVKFNSAEYMSDRASYKRKYAEAFRYAGAIADGTYQSTAGPATSVGQREWMKLPFVGTENYVDLRNPAGRALSWMTGWPQREVSQVIKNLRALRELGGGSGSSREAQQLIGVMVGTLTYALLNGMRKNLIAQAWADDDDEEQKELEAQFDQMYTPEGLAETSLIAVTQLGAARYSGVGRMLSVAIGSGVLYAMEQQGASPEKIEKTKQKFKDVLYMNPIELKSSFGAKKGATEFFMSSMPALNGAISAIGDVQQISADMQHLVEKSKKEGLTTEEADRLVLIRLTLNLVNTAGLVLTDGKLLLPFTAELKKWIKVKEEAAAGATPEELMKDALAPKREHEKRKRELREQILGK
jgi:hypothetical protein